MRKKICFVAFYSYPLLSSNSNLKYIGGAELKQVLIGKELAKRGYEISFITYDEKNETKTSFDGITIVKTFPHFNNFSLVKKARYLWNSLKKTDADIYIQSGDLAGIIPLFCFINKKKYVKWLSSDTNVLLREIEKSTTLFRKIILYFDIKFSNIIITQNKFQKNVVERKFKKKNVIIKNPIIIQQKSPDMIKRRKQNIVLWVSTIRSIKQPELFLKIAEILPNYRFRMIGGMDDVESELYKKIRENTKKLINLEFLGFIPHDLIDRYYEESTILVNTSKIEGFPNTFLEAWINYLPVVSLNVDPDEIICNNNLGLHSKTFDQLIIDTENLLTNEKLRNGMGINGFKYVCNEHNIIKITDKFVDLLDDPLLR